MQIPCLNKLLRRDSAGLLWDRGASNMMQTKKKHIAKIVSMIGPTNHCSITTTYANGEISTYQIFNHLKWLLLTVEKSERPQSFQHCRSNLRSWLLVPCWFLTKHCEGNSKYNVESNTTSCMFQCIGIGVQRIFLLNCRFSLPHLVNGRKFMLTAFTLRPKSWRMWRCMSMWCKHKHISNNIIEWCWWIIILLLLNQRLLRHALQSSRKYCMYIYTITFHKYIQKIYVISKDIKG